MDRGVYAELLDARQSRKQHPFAAANLEYPGVRDGGGELANEGEEALGSTLVDPYIFVVLIDVVVDLTHFFALSRLLGQKVGDAVKHGISLCATRAGKVCKRTFAAWADVHVISFEP